MIVQLARYLRRKDIQKAEARNRFCQSHCSHAQIFSFQVTAFNKVWADAIANVPFYAEWKKIHGLPDSIESLAELREWPVVTKKDFQMAQPEQLKRNGLNPTRQILTGGSTGEPIRLGAWADNFSGTSMLMGRKSYGIEVGDKWLHLWGHRHLYGRGWRRFVAVRVQMLKDMLQNRLRISSYDLSEEAMRRAYVSMERFCPKIFGGFSAAVVAFCRINANAGRFPRCPAKVVFCTAGPLSRQEKIEIESYFKGALICMEYGGNDCGVMAYTTPSSGDYRVFWDSHILQGKIDEHGECANIVTRLDQCYVPIIRYNVGDYLELEANENLDSILEFKSVKGRPSDVVTLKNGASFFGALVGDCVKQVRSVVSSQTEVVCGEKIVIKIVAIGKLSENDKRLIKDRFCDVASSVRAEDISVLQVEPSELVRTLAGKIPLIVRRDV